MILLDFSCPVVFLKWLRCVGVNNNGTSQPIDCNGSVQLLVQMIHWGMAQDCEWSRVVECSNVILAQSVIEFTILGPYRSHWLIRILINQSQYLGASSNKLRYVLIILLSYQHGFDGDVKKFDGDFLVICEIEVIFLNWKRFTIWSLQAQMPIGENQFKQGNLGIFLCGCIHVASNKIIK